jgi:chitinase
MYIKRISLLFSFILSSITTLPSLGQATNTFNVIAYFAGNAAQLDSFNVANITHLIYCFGHLQGNSFILDKAADTLIINKMVALKRQQPQLKVLLSLGGWGGCETCSPVFSTNAGRQEFAESVKAVQTRLHTDGIDLDWEYPAIEGLPGHPYSPADRKNFTRLVKQLRKSLGKESIISFAAGGFKEFLDKSVEWKKVMKDVDFVNLMTYDLVNGYATKTGHHTPLYSTSQQAESTDHAVQYLRKLGIDSRKLVIGGAFYARIFENVASTNQGLYQSAKFKSGIGYKQFFPTLTPDKGYAYYWDEEAKAPYLYNAQEKLFATFDGRRSIELKTKYVVDQQLGGIMFWQLADDLPEEGLLDVISEVKNSYRPAASTIK